MWNGVWLWMNDSMSCGWVCYNAVNVSQQAHKSRCISFWYDCICSKYTETKCVQSYVCVCVCMFVPLLPILFSRNERKPIQQTTARIPIPIRSSMSTGKYLISWFPRVVRRSERNEWNEICKSQSFTNWFHKTANDWCRCGNGKLQVMPNVWNCFIV